MNNSLEKLISMSRRVRLEPDEKAQMRSDWERVVRESEPSRQIFYNHHSSPFSFMLQKFAWGLAAIALVAAGVTSYAYASPSVTRGDSLYSVKMALEARALERADSRLERVRVHTKHALRRLAEVKTLVRDRKSGTAISLLRVPVAHAQEQSVELSIGDNNGDIMITITLQDMRNSTEQAIEEAEELTNPEELDEALNVVAETLDQEIIGLEEVAGEVGTDGSEDVVDAVAVALDDTNQNAVDVSEAAEQVAAAVDAGAEDVEVDIDTSADASADDTDDADDAQDGAEVEGEEGDEGNADQVKLEAMQQAIATFKASLLESGVSEDDAQKLFDRVDRKLLKAQEAFEEGNAGKMQGLLKATNALTNNAKHFAKKAQGKQRSGENDQAEVGQQEYEGEEDQEEDQGVEEAADEQSELTNGQEEAAAAANTDEGATGNAEDGAEADASGKQEESSQTQAAGESTDSTGASEAGRKDAKSLKDSRGNAAQGKSKRPEN